MQSSEVTHEFLVLMGKLDITQSWSHYFFNMGMEIVTRRAIYKIQRDLEKQLYGRI